MEKYFKKSVRQSCRELGISRSYVHPIFGHCKWIIPVMVYAINKDNPDRRKQFKEWHLEKSIGYIIFG